MEEKIIRRNIVEFSRKAEKNRRAGELMFEKKFYEDAISKAYYSYLFWVKALLIREGIAVKSHNSARTQFANCFVKNGIIESRYSKYFARLLDNRFQCDYDEMYIAEKIQAEEAMKMLDEFVIKAKKILKLRI